MPIDMQSTVIYNCLLDSCNTLILSNFLCLQTVDAITQEQHTELKQEVRRMITATANKLAHKLHMIDAVQRLCVAYHFEKEIEDELGKISYDLDNGNEDLYTVSLRFRLFRQKGVKISCGMYLFFVLLIKRLITRLLLLIVQLNISMYINRY